MDKPVTIEVDEDAKYVVVLVPWNRLAATTWQNQQEWLDKVAGIREHWHAKGYESLLRTDLTDSVRGESDM